MSIVEPITQVSLYEEKVAGGSGWTPWLFGSTIFLAAFLLFLVQPILGKMILPWFGGGAGVWAACLLYFQMSLLAGYAYAHCLRRYLSPKWQVQLHICLLAASILLLPIVPSPHWRHLGHIDPALKILGLLSATIGLPYLLVSSTSPLLQAWYAAIRPGASPYRLYALSNLGSLLGLVSFPAIVEPRLTSSVQAWGWSGAYIFFGLLCVAVAFHARRHGLHSVNARPSKERPEFFLKQGFGIQVLWVALAACGAALMMSATNYLTQNLAPIPLLWVLPLGLYLFSFVLCFETERVYQRLLWIPAMLIGIGAMAFIMFNHGGTTNLKLSVPVMLAGLFCCCMVCHGELARHKPETRFLTYFYLLVSVGGVLGGFFVAIIAPHVFKTYIELPICMVVCVGLAYIVVAKETVLRSRWWKVIPHVILIGFLIALTAYITIHKLRIDRHYLVTGKTEIFNSPIFDADSVEDINSDPHIRLWTDGYSNVLQILQLNRIRKEEEQENPED